MKIISLEIENFRNYDYLSLFPNENINIFLGRNASGKTNILEAISMLISGKSFRTSRDREILKFGEESFKINALIEINNLEKDYSLTYSDDKKKKIQINLTNIDNLKELRRDNALIVFKPEDLEIVKDGPNLRRKFFDDLISNLDLIYRYNLSKYETILKQKNDLLKSRNGKLDTRLLFEAYNIQLSSLGSYIIYMRKKVLRRFNEIIAEVHSDISNGEELLEIEYMNPHSEIDDMKKIEIELLNELRDSLDRDLMLKYSTKGPHRDEYMIKLNKKELKRYGSQGQQRSSVLSMKISELKIIREERKMTPIFLMDDVFSELDKDRRKKLIENIRGVQTFITMAEENYLEDFNNMNKNLYIVRENGVKKIGGKNAEQ